MAVPIYVSPAVPKESFFSTAESTLIFWLFDNRHPSRYEAIYHCSFMFIFLTINYVEYLFIYLLGIFISALEKYLFRSMFNWLIWFLIVSGINSLFFYINPLSHMWFANIFFHSIGCLFIFWLFVCVCEETF